MTQLDPPPVGPPERPRCHRRVTRPATGGQGGPVRIDPTSDDRDLEGTDEGESQRDRWFEEQRPPHWE